MRNLVGNIVVILFFAFAVFFVVSKLGMRVMYKEIQNMPHTTSKSAQPDCDWTKRELAYLPCVSK